MDAWFWEEDEGISLDEVVAAGGSAAVDVVLFFPPVLALAFVVPFGAGLAFVLRVELVFGILKKSLGRRDLLSSIKGFCSGKSLLPPYKNWKNGSDTVSLLEKIF